MIILTLTDSLKSEMLLRKKLRNGDFLANGNDKMVWESDPIFVKHKLY